MPRLTPDMIAENVARMLASRHVHGAALAVHHAPSDTCEAAAGGNLTLARPFFAASVTKMLVTIAVMRLTEAGRISLDDPMARFLPADLIAGLHMMKGVDRTGKITIRHLISSHTGLRDYFALKGTDGRSNMDRLMAGEDSAWPLERTLEAVRGKPALFAPGAPGKASYSDTNYQLMGRILETVTGQPLADLFRTVIFEPLGLRETRIYTDISDTSPAPIHAGPRALHLPRYIASISAEGGMVTTAPELAQIARAFFDGRFFALAPFMAQQNWRLILWPGTFHFGLGLERLWTPWFYSPLRPIRDVMGFWGQTGAFAFHHPETGLTFAGTVNQASGWGHASAVRAMLRLIKAMRA